MVAVEAEQDLIQQEQELVIKVIMVAQVTLHIQEEEEEEQDK